MELKWKRKEGPFVTWGRALHGLVGSVLALGGYILGGDGGMAIGIALGAVVGVLWEKLTPHIGPLVGWDHPFADLGDALCFTSGGVITGLMILGAT